MATGRNRVIIGVDVGGTNTDAVLMQSDHQRSTILSSAKTPTTEDITDGVKFAIAKAINDALTKQDVAITQVHIGTTHFVNAVVQRQSLVKVAVIRLCGSASLEVPPFIDIPEDLSSHINGGSYFVNGGYEFDGREISPVDEDEIKRCLHKIQASGINNVAVSGIFSPVRTDQEKMVGKIINQNYPNMSVTVASEIGQMGLLERENAAILNECLKPLSEKTINGFKTALHDLGLDCPFYLTQNDGTIVSEQTARKFPVCTFSSGPTNSMRGAAFLSEHKEAVVVDIGGTTTDVGILLKGFPREASSEVRVGGMRTNFRMPDVLSIGLGGGSYVDLQNPEQILIGPQSAGYNIMNEAFVFSEKEDRTGRRLTATDVAVAKNLCQIGNKVNVMHLSEDVVDSTIAEIKQMVERAIDQMKTSPEDVPLILVGGGSVLIDKSKGIKGTSEVISPDNADVANAVGAALSQVSGTVEYTVNLLDKVDNAAMTADIQNEIKKNENISAKSTEIAERDIRKSYLEKAHVLAMEEACNLAVLKAEQNGADVRSITIVEKMDTQLSYLPGNATKVKVRAVGELKHSASGTTNVYQKHDCLKLDTKTNVSRCVEKQSFTVTGERLVRKEERSTKTPYIEAESGEWILSAYDIECISTGAGILGCGGGGSPYLGKIRALKALKEGKVIKVVDPEHHLKNANPLNDLTLVVAYMGAPSILTEKLSSNETTYALQCMKDLYSTGKYSNGSLGDENGIEIKKDDGISYVDNYNPRKDATTETVASDIGDRKIVALMSAEIGGMNSIEPLLVSADLHIPVVDCDGMGRAFPELQMFTPLIYGMSPYPSTLADDKGRRAVVLKTDSAKHLEDHFRKVVVEMGCSAGLTISSLTKEDVLHKTVKNTLSRAWQIGQAVNGAREENRSPIKAITDTVGGKELISGKIIQVKRETTGGFNRGHVMVEGTDSFVEVAMKVEFQNENLVVRDESNQTSPVLACVPDLITLIDSDTGESIPTESLRYGLRVSVLVLPCPDILYTDQALKYLGPQAFGYGQDVRYQPCGEYKVTKTVFEQYGLPVVK